jgi:hypothetical protein
MIPKDFIHKCMFVFLYDFTNKKKILFFILILYIFLLFYFSINDGFTISIFILSYMLLFIRAFSINKTLNKEFERYKKYLRLKRNHNGKN